MLPAALAPARPKGNLLTEAVRLLPDIRLVSRLARDRALPRPPAAVAEFADRGLSRLVRGHIAALDPARPTGETGQRASIPSRVMETAMELTVLHVCDCPHGAVLRERLAEALPGRPDATVTWREIISPQEAETAGTHGSPTLLADGADLFAPPGRPPSLSCRLGGLPTADEIRATLFS